MNLAVINGKLPLANILTESIEASANLRNSNDAQKTTTSASYIKLKETKLNADLPACTIKFDLYGGASGSDYAKAKLYKNGVALGVERTGTTGWVTHSEDFSGFVLNDLIQIYGHSGSGNTCYVKNLRFYYDANVTELQNEALDTALTLTKDPTISMTAQDP